MQTHFRTCGCAGRSGYLQVHVFHIMQTMNMTSDPLFIIDVFKGNVFTSRRERCQNCLTFLQEKVLLVGSKFFPLYRVDSFQKNKINKIKNLMFGKVNRKSNVVSLVKSRGQSTRSISSILSFQPCRPRQIRLQTL